MNLFVPGLLAGRAIALAGGVPENIAGELSDLGGRVERVGELDVADDAVGDWARSHAPLDGLLYDSGGAFAAGGENGLLRTMEEAWSAVRELAVGALLDAQGPSKIVLVGPRPQAGARALAACAALENLSRTLSVEWARHNVTAVAVVPGDSGDQDALAKLICFLCSPAGEYLSGCRIDVGQLGP